MATPERLTSDRTATGLKILIYALAGALVVALAVVTSSTPLSVLLRPWYLSRAAGFVAYVLLWASVAVGLLQSTRSLQGVVRAIATTEVHDYLSMAAIYTTLFHGVILLFDEPNYSFSLAETLVPFATTRHPFLMAAGIVALYLSLLAALTTYLRRYMPPKVWRVLHLTSLVGFVGAMVHGIFLGSDTGSLAAGLLYAATGGTAGALLLYRIFTASRPAETSAHAARYH